MLQEIIFLAGEAPEGGYVAQALVLLTNMILTS